MLRAVLVPGIVKNCLDVPCCGFQSSSFIDFEVHAYSSLLVLRMPLSPVVMILCDMGTDGG